MAIPPGSNCRRCPHALVEHLVEFSIDAPFRLGRPRGCRIKGCDCFAYIGPMLVEFHIDQELKKAADPLAVLMGVG